MKAMFVLTPAESKRLLAKAVAQMDEVREALRKAYVVIVGGTTNGFIAQEIAGLDVEPQSYTAGTSTKGVLCVTPTAGRDTRIPIVLYKGQRVQKTIPEVFQDFHLLPGLTALENAILPAVFAGSDSAAAEAQAREVLVHLGVRIDDTPTAVLSRGERQISTRPPTATRGYGRPRLR